MKAEALERINTRWLPDPAYEDTRTIALNVGGYFMDLRVAKDTASIDWAQAGERTILKEDPRTCQWTHIIDSLDLTEPDEAQLFKLPNGDELEVGSTPCPLRGGAMTSFEEVWRNVTVHFSPGDPSWILQSSRGTTFMGKVGNIYLALRKDKEVGFVARREELCQAGGDWEITFESGDVKSLPRVAQVAHQLGVGQRAWTIGESVGVGGVEYIIRGFDRN
ncbi:Fc.00g079200.m01.CDS01 [Cosmosporella sp. VM-42]